MTRDQSPERAAVKELYVSCGISESIPKQVFDPRKGKIFKGHFNDEPFEVESADDDLQHGVRMLEMLQDVRQDDEIELFEDFSRRLHQVCHVRFYARRILSQVRDRVFGIIDGDVSGAQFPFFDTRKIRAPVPQPSSSSVRG